MELTEANLRKALENGDILCVKCDGLPLDTANKEGCWIEVMPVKVEPVIADCEVMFRVCTPQYQGVWKAGTLEEAGMFAHKVGEDIRKKEGKPPEYLRVLLDACGIDHKEEWVKHLETYYHDFGDGEGPQEMVSQSTLQQLMEHCKDSEMKVKLRELLGAL